MKLRCEIHHDEKPVNSLHDGLMLNLEGQLEKNSEILGRNAIWRKNSKVHKLPQYLCVQFIRFYWKAEASTTGNKAGKAKILRKVIFPRVIDMFQYASDELKTELMKGRDLDSKIREIEDNQALQGKAEEEKKEEEPVGDVEMKDDSKMQTNSGGAAAASSKEAEKAVGAKAKAKWVMEEIKKHDEALYKPHGEGLATGNYQIVGLVTHKGRSADGGHYVGWVHASGDDWLQCDDDIVTEVKLDDILQLSGGGDWPTAYLAIYRRLEVSEK